VTYEEAVTRLEIGLAAELPGEAAQLRLAPRPRHEWPSGFNPARIRLAAGLLLVYASLDVDDRDERARAARDPRTASAAARIVLTVRTETVRHAGQVSLPGGVVDPGETFDQAALREAHEEVALRDDDVRVIGALSPLDIPVSGFRLHPIVATLPRRPSLHPSDGEVARIVEVDVDELLAPSALVETTRVRDGRTFHVPAFRVAGVEVWGATAMILAEFLTLLGWDRP
jgi:8-oxo-dGTP pyrophosphatase MutT (NUDIX family)